MMRRKTLVLWRQKSADIRVKKRKPPHTTLCIREIHQKSAPPFTGDLFAELATKSSSFSTDQRKHPNTPVCLAAVRLFTYEKKFHHGGYSEGPASRWRVNHAQGCAAPEPSLALPAYPVRGRPGRREGRFRARQEDPVRQDSAAGRYQHDRLRSVAVLRAARSG